MPTAKQEAQQKDAIERTLLHIAAMGGWVSQSYGELRSNKPQVSALIKSGDLESVEVRSRAGTKGRIYQLTAKGETAAVALSKLR
jgi:hypothetical protein